VKFLISSHHKIIKPLQIYATVSCLSAKIRSYNNVLMPLDSDSVEVKIDNCCSRTLSGHKTDFIKGTLKPVHNLSVEGYSTTGEFEPVTHEGTIKWTVLDDNGTRCELIIPKSLYVPTNDNRLLSPQHLAQVLHGKEKVNHGTRCTTYAHTMVLEWDNCTHKVTVPIDKRTSNIGRMYTAPGFSNYMAYATKTVNLFPESVHHPNTIVCHKMEIRKPEEIIVEEGEIVYEQSDRQEDGLILANVSFKKAELTATDSQPEVERLEATTLSPEDELLRWHQRLSHVSMTRLQRLAKLGILPSRIASCKQPLCQACVFGKLTRRPWRYKTKKEMVEQPLKIVWYAGRSVSVDQLESPIPGLIGQMKGILTKKRYKVATVFVDHFTNLSYVHLQTSTNALETLEAKHEFERFAQSCGVQIRHYHADNGRFAESVWKDDIQKKGQQLTFSGVGAHHQNGRAEKRIRDLQDLARTSLIHAHRRWPEAIDARLWPYALRHANHALNSTPFGGESKSPVEKFCGFEAAPTLDQHHPFGCPAYALDGKIQSGKKAPKWELRARLAINLGPSLQHAGSVGLVLSLSTGLVSPQFHVRYDDAFETLQQGAGRVPCRWQQLAAFEKLRPTLMIEKAILPVSSNQPTVMGQARLEHILEVDQTNNQGDQLEQDNPQVIDMDDEEDAASIQENADENQLPTTRSGRVIRQPARYGDYVAFNCDLIISPEGDDNKIFAYSASTDPDVLYLHQAMAAPDKDEFKQAMEQEVNSHSDNVNWIVMNREDVPDGHTVLPAIWAMRRKRDISTRAVYKWKARLNIHGGKQVKGLNYWDTYAPVASWAAIRIIMAIATLRQWKTKQMDFVLAFPQAPVETDLYMEIPTGFGMQSGATNKVLKLQNNLYGQKQAGRVWNLFLIEGLAKIGFKQSLHDPCVFWRDYVILIIYTDDTIITGPNEGHIDRAIKQIGECFNITHKPSVEDFLGVKITRDYEAKSIKYTQPHLIDSILNDLELTEKSNTRDIPALPSKIMQKFESSPAHSEDWSYRSVIGKLQYLEKSTRPDIAYAVHQCARFSESPRLEHSKAVKLIGRYLLGTKEMGMFVVPTEESFIDWSDADFSGNWDPPTAEHDPMTAKSRSGCVV
jgi:hypothetical protein